ncbi:MAG: T9SS type A sorting domain-containing protein [Saprospiraceae bacterium]|nr:T9SS type A sorting domain-containing protein [Saprospiraceae bacterium]
MKPRFTFTLLILLFSLCQIQAKHLLGGTVSYKVLGKSSSSTQVEISFFMYKDDTGGGANFDSFAPFGVYGANGNNYNFLFTINENPSNVEQIEIMSTDSCSFLSYSVARYTFEVELPNSTYEKYVIGYVRCCTATNISNIDPMESGMALALTLYPAAFEFEEEAKVVPVTSIPFFTGEYIDTLIDMSIDDEYTKEYLLTRPLVGGGIAGVNFGDPQACDGITPNPLNCPPPYAGVVYLDEDTPYGMGSEVNLDAMTGEFHFNIPTLGIILFEMTINRYAEGEILSSVNHRWTTNTSVCIETNVEEPEPSFCQDIKIIPNPTADFISVNCNILDVVILDATGKVVKKYDAFLFGLSTDVSDLSNGLYTVKATTFDEEPITLRFVKTGPR